MFLKKTLYLCLVEDAIASAMAIALIIVSGKFLLSLFNNNPQVIEIGYTRLIVVFTAYIPLVCFMKSCQAI